MSPGSFFRRLGVTFMFLGGLLFLVALMVTAQDRVMGEDMGVFGLLLAFAGFVIAVLALIWDPPPPG